MAGSIIAGLIVAAAVVFVARHFYKTLSGKSGCGCACGQSSGKGANCCGCTAEHNK